MLVRRLFPALSILAVAAAALADPPVRVEIQDDKNEVQEITLPIDPQIRAQPTHGAGMRYGLNVEGKRLTFSTASAGTVFKIDGQVVNPNSNTKPLPAGPNNKPRYGVEQTFVYQNLHITQIQEIVPGRPSAKPKPGEKRRMDTLLLRWIVENKDTKPHNLAMRLRMDTYCLNNDGCLFASPEKFPGKILDGVELKGKDVPDYVQILANNDLQNPIWIAHFTFRFGSKYEGPSRVIFTSHGQGDNGWDTAVMQAGGDSEAAFYWDEKAIPPGGKREMAFGHGQGIASDPESEGRVNLEFGGAFEPGKYFTVSAFVNDPQDSQALTLDVPAGLVRVDGPPTQAVPAASEMNASLVVWKVRVDKVGDFALKVRSSNGVTYNTLIKIQLADKAELIRVLPKPTEPEPKQPLPKVKGKDDLEAAQGPASGEVVRPRPALWPARPPATMVAVTAVLSLREHDLS